MHVLVLVHVHVHSAAAMALYDSAGFVREGTRVAFVRLEDGTLIDDHIMVRFAE